MRTSRGGKIVVVLVCIRIQLETREQHAEIDDLVIDKVHMHTCQKSNSQMENEVSRWFADVAILALDSLARNQAHLLAGSPDQEKQPGSEVETPWLRA